MPRVMFSVSYTIKPALRERYLGLIRQLKGVQEGKNKAYSVFETKGKANHFTEVFTLNSLDEFEAMDDNQDEQTEELISKVGDCVDNQGMKYQTMIEIA